MKKLKVRSQSNPNESAHMRAYSLIRNHCTIREHCQYRVGQPILDVADTGESRSKPAGLEPPLQKDARAILFAQDNVSYYLVHAEADPEP